MVTESMYETRNFMMVLTIFVGGFTLSTYYRKILLLDECEPENRPIFSAHLYETVFTAFGDFGEQTESIDS
jgi:hypothetical protein